MVTIKALHGKHPEETEIIKKTKLCLYAEEEISRQIGLNLIFQN